MTAPRLRFERDALHHPAVVELLRLHLRSAHASSPACKVHALDLSKLQDPAVTFFAAWDEHDALAGMGALKMLDAGQAEIKSMRVAPGYQRRGIGSAILEHLLSEARARGIARISLETGGNDAFAPARRLYERAGFERCAAFADYTVDEFSSCYSRVL